MECEIVSLDLLVRHLNVRNNAAGSAVVEMELPYHLEKARVKKGKPFYLEVISLLLFEESVDGVGGCAIRSFSVFALSVNALTNR